jgi:hypothetical protein
VKLKLSEKKRKKLKKSAKKVKKSEKSEKIDLNFASLCFASKQKKRIDLLYINDLPLNSLLNDFLFADDTTLLASGPDLPELIEFVNDEFHKICTYFRQNKLVLHPGKTQYEPWAKTACKMLSQLSLAADFTL